ncbi:MAG: lipid-A-disaccharide synthase [Gammaproteobacteria bacterium]|nr:lipid-A-disaccharide synthase [Gammaproteobacteria bacterium]
MRVGIVANEVSGDMLGAGLMRELKSRLPNVQFEGIAGPRMQELGCTTLFPMEKLSVMGLVEVLSHLPEVLSIRRSVRNHFLSNPPDLFIGIDGPDFNLSLERDLKQAGITTVHYVCPSVWAWRAGRVNKIRASVDMVLSLFPFEREFLEKHQVPATHVGHPLADEIPLDPDQPGARERLGLDLNSRVIAILPGSRSSEVSSLSEDFIRAAMQCQQRFPQMRFVVPLVNQRIRELFEQTLQQVAPELPITLVDGNARDVLQAADVVLTASGTATLEALLLKRPMVIAYRLHWLTHWIFTYFNLIKSPFISLANMLAGEEIAPEILQDAVQPQVLADALIRVLEKEEKTGLVQEVGNKVHRELRLNASSRAADAVLDLLRSKQVHSN